MFLNRDNKHASWMYISLFQSTAFYSSGFPLKSSRPSLSGIPDMELLVAGRGSSKNYTEQENIILGNKISFREDNCSSIYWTLLYSVLKIAKTPANRPFNAYTYNSLHST